MRCRQHTFDGWFLRVAQRLEEVDLGDGEAEPLVVCQTVAPPPQQPPQERAPAPPPSPSPTRTTSPSPSTSRGTRSSPPRSERSIKLRIKLRPPPPRVVTMADGDVSATSSTPAPPSPRPGPSREEALRELLVCTCSVCSRMRAAVRGKMNTAEDARTPTPPESEEEDAEEPWEDPDEAFQNKRD